MELLGKIGLFIFAISYIVGLTYVIRDMILVLIPALKCRKISKCKKDDCPFRRGCTHISYSDKERAYMQTLINRLK